MRIIKKLAVIFMTISLLSLFGCGRKPKYTVNCGPGIEAEKTSYREGEEVTLRVHTVMDETADMFIDGKMIQSGPGSDDEWYVYTFTMPAHDVEAKCVYTNISVVPEPEDEKDTLLISCYGRVVGTELPRPYDKAALFRKADGSLLLRTEHGVPDDLEIHEYTVPESCLEDAMNCILENGMDTWNELFTCDPIDGYYCSCAFLLDGKWIALDSEGPMPSNGINVMDRVRNILMGYAAE